MADKEVHEKDEKQYDEKDEKELLKHDEKVEQQDALGSVIWAAILIWAGLVFLGINTGWLDRIVSGGFFSQYLPDELQMFEPRAWSLIMLGAGVILLVEVVIRLLVPSFHRHVGGTLITAVVFIGVGLGSFIGWEFIWPVILISVGVAVLLGGLFRKKI